MAQVHKARLWDLELPVPAKISTTKPCTDQKTPRDHMDLANRHLGSNLMDQEPEKLLEFSALYKDPGVLSCFSRVSRCPK